MKSRTKRILGILLIIGCLLFVIDKIVIIRLKYDINGDTGQAIDYSSSSFTVGKGDYLDCPDRCWGYKRILNDGKLFVGFSMDGLRAYYINDICCVDGVKKEMHYYIVFPEGVIHGFWNAFVEVYFLRDNEGKIYCEMDCNNGSRIEIEERGESTINCSIYP